MSSLLVRCGPWSAFVGAGHLRAEISGVHCSVGIRQSVPHKWCVKLIRDIDIEQAEIVRSDVDGTSGVSRLVERDEFNTACF
jgi:hypothetical protein